MLVASKKSVTALFIVCVIICTIAYKHTMKARVTRVLESLYPQRFQLAIKHYNGALPAELTIPEPIIKEPSLIKEIQIKSGLFSIKLNKEYFPENAHIELSPKFKHGELIWVCRASDNILKYTPSYCEKDF